jgi:hypothetical protein
MDAAEQADHEYGGQAAGAQRRFLGIVSTDFIWLRLTATPECVPFLIGGQSIDEQPGIL